MKICSAEREIRKLIESSDERLLSELGVSGLSSFIKKLSKELPEELRDEPTVHTPPIEFSDAFIDEYWPARHEYVPEGGSAPELESVSSAEVPDLLFVELAADFR